MPTGSGGVDGGVTRFNSLMPPFLRVTLNFDASCTACGERAVLAGDSRVEPVERRGAFRQRVVGERERERERENNRSRRVTEETGATKIWLGESVCF